MSTINCRIDGLDELLVRGWAFDKANPRVPAVLHMIVDGQEVGVITCDRARPDVHAAGIAPEHVGFEFRLPAALLDDEMHEIEVRDDWRRNVVMFVNHEPATSLTAKISLNPEIRSFVDGLRQGAFEGWVLRKAHSTAPFQGDAMIRVTCDGATIGHVRANRHRGDVARMLSASPNCGFHFVPPASVRRGFPRDYRFYLMPDDVELSNSPQHTSVVADAGEAQLLDLMDSVDSLHRELTRIRRQIRDILPRPGHTLATYDTWYPRYADALRRRIAATPDAPDAPLVSIVCPSTAPTSPSSRPRSTACAPRPTPTGS